MKKFLVALAAGAGLILIGCQKEAEALVTTIKSRIGGLASVALSLLGLAIVLQVLFGPDVVFVPVDVIGNIQNLVAALGSSGLVGLITVGVIYWILKND